MHVYRIGLDRASDLAVWNAARTRGYVIVSQDADFSDLSAMFGAPPKVIWIRRGNCSTFWFCSKTHSDFAARR